MSFFASFVISVLNRGLDSERRFLICIQRVNQDLREIEELRRSGITASLIEFPRGVLNTVSSHQRQLPESESVMSKNIAYSLMGIEATVWLLTRTDLAGIAKEMLIKRCLATYAEICDALITTFTKGQVAKPNSYNKRVEYLEGKKILSNEMAVSLRKLWALRNDVHLTQPTEREAGKYSMSQLEKAEVLFEYLRDQLRHWSA